jgi:hypothetical protein
MRVALGFTDAVRVNGGAGLSAVGVSLCEGCSWAFESGVFAGVGTRALSVLPEC